MSVAAGRTSKAAAETYDGAPERRERAQRERAAAPEPEPEPVPRAADAGVGILLEFTYSGHARPARQVGIPPPSKA